MVKLRIAVALVILLVQGTGYVLFYVGKLAAVPPELLPMGLLAAGFLLGGPTLQGIKRLSVDVRERPENGDDKK